MRTWFKNWITGFFKKEEICAHCGRRLFANDKYYPIIRPIGKIENIHRECLYRYLLKNAHREDCDRIYKLLTA